MLKKKSLYSTVVVAASIFPLSRRSGKAQGKSGAAACMLQVAQQPRQTQIHSNVHTEWQSESTAEEKLHTSDPISI